MNTLKKALKRTERFRNITSGTIAILVLLGTLSLKFPLAFLVFLGLVYVIYRIIKDRKNESTPEP